MIIAWLMLLVCLSWVFFAYVGYPVAMWLLSQVAPRQIEKGQHSPALSVIIAVHNGAHEIADKLEGTLALEYTGSVQVIVSSDGSTDSTVAIASEFEDRGVEVVRSEERGGKEAAQARAIERASGDVLVFTDVSAKLGADALTRIVEPFHDASIGAVSSQDDVDSTQGEGLYVRLEMLLRRLESTCTSLVGVSGSFFAVRKGLATPWPSDLASDFRIALESARRGYRAVSEPEALASFRTVSDASAEWNRKVRTVRRGIAVLAAYPDLLDPRKGLISFSLWGHKVARFTSPFALMAVFVISLTCAPASLAMKGLLTAQLVAYGLAVAALLWPRFQEMLLPRLAAFFVVVNASMVVAWGYHLSGQRAIAWQPTKR